MVVVVGETEMLLEEMCDSGKPRLLPLPVAGASAYRSQALSPQPANPFLLLLFYTLQLTVSNNYVYTVK
jgi:hypothetical protein